MCGNLFLLLKVDHAAGVLILRLNMGVRCGCLCEWRLRKDVWARVDIHLHAWPLMLKPEPRKERELVRPWAPSLCDAILQSRAPRILRILNARLSPTLLFRNVIKIRGENIFYLADNLIYNFRIFRHMWCGPLFIILPWTLPKVRNGTSLASHCTILHWPWWWVRAWASAPGKQWEFCWTHMKDNLPLTTWLEAERMRVWEQQQPSCHHLE